MAVETVKSTHIGKRDTNAAVQSPAAKSFGLLRESIAKVTVAASASVASKYILFEIGSSDRLSSLLLKYAALGVGCLADIGIYDTVPNGGAVVDADVLSNDVDVAAAGSTTITPAAADMEKQVWELLGLSSDPHKQYDVVVTLAGAAVAGGALGARMQHVTF